MAMKEIATSGRLQVGTMLVEFDTPGIGQIMKAAGIDFAFIDMEHSGFEYESLKRTLRYLQSAELASFVRVPSSRYDHIARALDVGAEGLLIPMVGSADEVRHVLDCMKYAPHGSRGVALQVAHDRYRPGPVMPKLRTANRRTTLLAQIETVKGIENVEEIAAVPGVDCLWVGQFDLSTSLGVPGQFDHPLFRDAVAKVVAAARRHGKVLGRMVPDVTTGSVYHRMGFDLVALSGDIWLYFKGLETGIDALRRRCRSRR